MKDRGIHMNSKRIAVLFTAACVILMGVILFLWLRQDREAPQLNFSTSEAVYKEGMDKSLLLEGVTAYDRQDGDLTKQILIEKITLNKEQSLATVTYAVLDQSGNVAKKARVFPAVGGTRSSGNIEGEAQNGEQETEAAEAGTEGNSAEGNGAEGSDTEATPTPEETPTATPTASPEPTGTPSPTPSAEPTPEAEAPAPTKTPVDIPVMELSTTSIKTQAGQTPAWVNVIRSLTDDKDSYTTLFSNLVVSKYDVNQKGDHTVTIYTMDSDGNSSVPQRVTVQVQ